MAEKRGWKCVGSESLKLSGEAAREFAAKHRKLPHSPTERKLKRDRVLFLQKAIAEGRAIPFNWAVVKFEGKHYRMNGQHSSEAIVTYEGELPEGLNFHVDRYEADHRQGMAELFRQFDPRQSTRSVPDISHAYQGLAPEIEGCDERRAMFAIQGVGWYQRSIEKVPCPDGDDVFQLFFQEKFYPYVRWAADEVLGVKTPEMLVIPVLSAMYITFTRSEDGARVFWKKVALNNLSDTTDPAEVLSKELCGIKDNKEKRKPGPTVYYAKCIKAWNAFRNGDKLPNLNVNTAKGLPEVAA